MPKLYQFPLIKCSENENFRTQSIAGCAYVPKMQDFKPHRNGYTPIPVNPIPAKPVNPIPVNPIPVNPIPVNPIPVNPTPVTPSSSNSSKTSSSLTANIKPLKKISKLTTEQINKGKMVAAAYELVKDDVRVGNQESGKVKFEDLDIVAKSRRSADTSHFLKNSGVENYRVVRDFSDRRVMVLNGRGEENGNIKLVFKGLAGKDSTPEELQHARETILRPNKRDYIYLDELYERVKTDFPNSKIEVISYSNGGAKGMYLGEKYNLPHYSIDPLLGKNELQLLMNRGDNAAPLEFVRTSRPALAMGSAQTLQEIIQSKSPSNTTITNIKPLAADSANPLMRLKDDHNLRSYTLPENARKTGGIGSRGALGSITAGIVPVALASYITEQAMPDAPEAAKIGAVSVGGAGLTKVISPLVGAGGVSATGLIAPLAGSLVAAEGGSALADVILPEEMETHTRQTLKGAVAGASGVGGFVGGGAAAGAVGRGISTAAANIGARAAGYSAVAETGGLELAGITAAGEIGGEVGEVALAAESGVEMVSIAEAGAAAVAGASEGAEIGASAAPETFGTSIIAGVVIGGAIGLVSSFIGGHKEQLSDREMQLQSEAAERQRQIDIYNAKAPLRESARQAELQRIRDAPAFPKGSFVIRTINDDAEYQNLIENGTIGQVNQRIREIVREKRDHYEPFRSIVSGYDPYPQLQGDGSWENTAWAEAPSFEENYDEYDYTSNDRPASSNEVWSDTPHPTTDHEYTPP